MAQGKTHVADPMLWDGEHPNLYSLQLNNQTKWAEVGRWCTRALDFAS